MSSTLQQTAQLAETRQRIAATFMRDSALADKNEATSAATLYLQEHCQCVDAFVIGQFRATPELSKLVLIATGGYGRGELYPYSDIDLLLLLPEYEAGGDKKRIEEKISELLQQLWDAGLAVSHAVRTLKDCAHWASEDLTVQTALLEARYLAGEVTLMHQLTTMMQRTLSMEDFFYTKSLEQLQRHQRYQNIDSSLEPNVKESPGGLRELHMLRWLEQAMRLHSLPAEPSSGLTAWQSWDAGGWLSAEEAADINRSENFLRRLRIHAHLHAKRHQDKILFDVQKALAQAMGYGQDAAPLGSKPQPLSSAELMMKDYYRHAMQVLSLNRLILGTIKADIQAGDAPDATPPKRLQYGLMVMPGALLDVDDEAPLHAHPEHMLKPFLWHHEIPDIKEMSPPLKRLLRSLRKRIAEVRHHPELNADFIRILKLPKGTITTLRELNRLGFLGEYLPAFGKIVGLMQHDLYHAYTVDQHILMVVRNLRRLMVNEFSHEHPEHTHLISKFNQPWRLLVAALFHDIAKGQGGNHSTLGAVAAREFCVSHGLAEADSQLIEWLVAEHLTFSTTAQREDLSDPQVIERFAARVQSVERLNALFLLTAADMRGTSPKVWNQWKSNLLSELRSRTLAHLMAQSGQKHEPTDSLPSAQSTLEEKKQLVLERMRMLGVEAERLWRTLQPDYYHAFAAEAMNWHLRVLLRYQQKSQGASSPMLSVAVRLAASALHWELLIIASHDHDALLLSKTCGHLAHLGYSVMGAKVSRWRDHEQLYHFEIASTHPSEAGSAERANMSVLEFTLTERLMSPEDPTPIVTLIPRQLRMSAFRPQAKLVLDESGSRFILSMATLDRLGLLYDVTRLLADWQANLLHAKINTLGNRVENVFVIQCEALKTTNALLQFDKQLLAVLAF